MMNLKNALCLALMVGGVLVGCSTTPVRQERITISQPDILALLDSIDRGLINQDAGAVVATFASNAVITATIVENQRRDTLEKDVATYRRSLEAGFQSFSDYRLTRTNITITMAANGQAATSMSTLTETFRFDGKKKHAVTTESAAFELIDGRIWLTKRNAEVTIKDLQQP